MSPLLQATWSASGNLFTNLLPSGSSAILDRVVSAAGGVLIVASLSEARFSSRFVLCLVPESAIDWQASVSFAA